MAETVEINRDALEELVWFARHGDVALSQRRLRNGFRRTSVCSGKDREPDCCCCQAFDAAEAALQ